MLIEPGPDRGIVWARWGILCSLLLLMLALLPCTDWSGPPSKGGVRGARLACSRHARSTTCVHTSNE